jgi:hypothetical protein
MSRPCEVFTPCQRQQIGSAIDTSADDVVAALIPHSVVGVLKNTRSGSAATSIYTNIALELLFHLSDLNAPMVPNQRISWR